MYEKKENADWLTFGTDKIRVDDSNIDNYIFDASTADPNILNQYLTDLNNIDKAVKTGAMSWQDYSNKLDENCKWIAQWGQETEGQIRTTDDLVQANQKARQAAIQYNAALKQQTLGAKAASVAMKGLALVGNIALSMLASFVVSKAIEGIDNFIHKSEKLKETLDELKSECDTIASDLESVNSELETTKQRMDELEGKGTLTFTEKEEYDNLVKQNNELKREKEFLETIAKIKNKDKNKAFVEVMQKDADKNNEYRAGKYTDSLSPYYDWNGTDKTEKDYITAQFAKRKELLDELRAADTKEEKERIQEQIDEIDNYLVGKNTEWTEGSSGISYIENPTSEDEKKVNQWLDFINDFQDRMAIAMGGDNAKTNAFNRVVDNWQFDDTVQELQDLGKQGKVTADMLDDPKYDAFIQKLVFLGVIDSADNLDEIALAFNNVGTEAETTGQNLNKTVTSLSNLASASEGISSLSTAAKELSDDGYITIDTISKIQEATKLSGEEWEHYQDILMNAKAGSAEFNQAMGALTYKILENKLGTKSLADATEEEIAAILRENNVVNASAVAHEISTKAKAANAVASYKLKNITEEEAIAIIKEAMSADEAKQYLAQLELAKIAVNNAKIDTSSDIEQIINLANAAGASTIALAKLAEYKSLYARYTSGEQLSFRDIERMSATEAQLESGAFDFGFEPIDPSKYMSSIKYSPSSSGKGSSSSYKNEALEGYLEGVEWSYEAHQDEARYINDLEWALNNLCKTEEERFEILKKIEKARKDEAKDATNDLEHQIDLKKKLYGDDYDATEDWNKVQEIAHNEAERLRALGYDDNSDEIQYWQNKWWEAEEEKQQIKEDQSEKRTEARQWEADAYERELSYIEKSNEQLEDMLDNTEDITDKFRILGDLIENTNESIDLNEAKKNQAHQNAEALRNDPQFKALIDKYGFDTESWFNADGSLNSQYKKDLSAVDEKDIYLVEELANGLEAYKKEWHGANDEIIEGKNNLADYQKQQDDLKIDTFLDAQQKAIDILDFRYNREAAIIDALKRQNELQQQIRQKQAEINTELETSKNLAEYLDEETTEHLFNDKDYSKLSKKLSSVSKNISKLYGDYRNDINNLSKDEWYKEAEITAQFEARLEVQMESYELLEKELEIAKKRTEYENIAKEPVGTGLFWLEIEPFLPRPHWHKLALERCVATDEICVKGVRGCFPDKRFISSCFGRGL